MRQLTLSLLKSRIISSLIVLQFFLATSCGLEDIKGAEGAIDYYSSFVSQHQDAFDSIYAWIDTCGYKPPYLVMRDRHQKAIIIYDNPGHVGMSNKEFAEYLRRTVLKPFHYMSVDMEYLGFACLLKNFQFEFYELYNYRDTAYIPDSYYETGHIPPDTCGWYYHIEGMWFLWSPCPE